MIINVSEALAEPEEDSRLEHAGSCRLNLKRNGNGMNGNLKQGSSMA